jgi:hypothetical protein
MLRLTFCDVCSSEIVKQVGRFAFKSKLLGEIFVPNVEKYICFNCGKTLISLEESSKIAKYVQQKEQEAIESMPISAFISMNEAAEILGVSKQAFSKNPRIKRGLICSAKTGGKTYYLKSSVIEFGRNGKDGRVKLELREKEVVYKVVPQQMVYYPGLDHRQSAYVDKLRTEIPKHSYVNCNEFKFRSQYCVR